MNAPNDPVTGHSPANGWHAAQDWVKRELDKMADSQCDLNTKMDRVQAELTSKIDAGHAQMNGRLNTLIMWMLSQTVVIIVAIFIELVRRRA